MVGDYITNIIAGQLNPLKALAAVLLNSFGLTKKPSNEPKVPKITPVYYPNRRPPKVATNLSLIK